MPEDILNRAKVKLQQAKDKVIIRQQGTFKRLQPDYRKYPFYIILSLSIGIILKVIDLKHDYFYNFISSTNQFLNISSVLQVDHSSIISLTVTIIPTIFAIIFALLMFFTQFSDEYSIIDIFEEEGTKFLVRLYFTTIVLSLVMLITTFQYPIFLLTLTLACIFSLYPFMHNISSKLADVKFAKLNDRIATNILNNNELSTSRDLVSLEKLCEGYIIENKKNNFIATMSNYDTITGMAIEQQMEKVIRLVGTDYCFFLDLFIKEKTEENNRNIMFSFLVININNYISKCSYIVGSDYLYTLFVQAPINNVVNSIKNGFENDDLNTWIVKLCYKWYNILKKRSTNDDDPNKFIDFTIGFIKSLCELTKESYNHKLDDSLTFSVGALFVIGTKLNLENEELKNEVSMDLISLVYDELNKIEKYIHHDKFEEVYDNFNSITHISWAFGELELKEHFDKFKKSYNTKDI